MLVTQKLENNKRTCTISIVICPWVSPQSRYSLFKRLLRGHDSLRSCWNIVKNIRMRKRTHNIYLSRLCLRVQYWPQSGLTVMYGLKKTNTYSTKYSGFWYYINNNSWDFLTILDLKIYTNFPMNSFNFKSFMPIVHWQ